MISCLINPSIQELLSKANMDQCKPITTPMSTNYPFPTHVGEPFYHPSFYKSVVGALQYITITKPNLSFVVNKVFRYMTNLLVPRWNAIKRIIRYLRDTLSYGIVLKPFHIFNFMVSLMLIRVPT